MGLIGSGVSLKGIHQEEFNYPFLVSGTVTRADEGKAVSLDTSAANTVKLTADGDIVVGLLEIFEDRKTEGIKIGTVCTKGGVQFEYTGTDPTIGQSVVGSATAGKVKAAAASAYNFVVEVDTTAKTCVVVLK